METTINWIHDSQLGRGIRLGLINQWEFHFYKQIAQQKRPLSSKQMLKKYDIENKINKSDEQIQWEIQKTKELHGHIERFVNRSDLGDFDLSFMIQMREKQGPFTMKQISAIENILSKWA
jgi:hypothetical protein